MVSRHTKPGSLSARLRSRRMQYLEQAVRFASGEGLLLADLGGTLSFWEMNLPHLCCRDHLARIDIFNLETGPVRELTVENVQVRIQPGDATCLNHIPDGFYDVAFSNSVIEHVGNLACQQRFAEEIRRIARRFVLQTPNRFFPLEPHFYVPFFAQLPLGLRAWLHQHFKLGWLEAEPDPLRARIDCDQIRLLSHRELRLLFPLAGIHREFLAGWVKSFIVFSAEAE